MKTDVFWNVEVPYLVNCYWYFIMLGLFATRYSIASKKTWHFINTTVRSPDLTHHNILACASYSVNPLPSLMHWHCSCHSGRSVTFSSVLSLSRQCNDPMTALLIASADWNQQPTKCHLQSIFEIMEFVTIKFSPFLN
jgi:hypothetical protein